MSKTNDNKGGQQQGATSVQDPAQTGSGAAAAGADEGLEQKSDAELWKELDAEDAAATGKDGKASEIDAAADNDLSVDGDGDPVTGSDDALATGGEAGGEKPKAPAVVDIWKDAKPEQRAAFEAAQAEAKKGEQYRKSNEGRVAALQRQVDQLMRQKTAQSGAVKGGAGQQAAGGFLDSQEYKKFSKEYPEIAGPMGKVIADLQAQVTGQTKMLDAIGSERLQKALNEQEATLVKDHADWEELAGQEGFGDWLAMQPRHIREAALRNGENIVDAQEAADVIGRYKDHLRANGKYQEPAKQQGGGNNGAQANGTGKTKQELDPKRQRQLGSAASSKSRGPGAGFGIPEDGDPKTIWKQMDAEEARKGQRNPA